MQHTPGQEDWREERRVLKTKRSQITSMVSAQGMFVPPLAASPDRDRAVIVVAIGVLNCGMFELPTGTGPVLSRWGLTKNSVILP